MTIRIASRAFGKDASLGITFILSSIIFQIMILLMNLTPFGGINITEDIFTYLKVMYGLNIIVLSIQVYGLKLILDDIRNLSFQLKNTNKNVNIPKPNNLLYQNANELDVIRDPNNPFK
tara:strand:- start:47 stop:403 length:357 start_codon:yes stop_codon:yes gene_type:complete